MSDYKLSMKNRTYPIPKYSIKIRRKMDEIDAVNADVNVDQEQKYRNMYEFICESVGDDKAKEIFDTSDFEEIDLNDITIAYLGICVAYDKPVIDAQKKNKADNISREDRELVMNMLKNAGNLSKLESIANGSNQNLRVLR